MSNLEMKVEALTRCVDPEVFARAMESVRMGTAPEPGFLPRKEPMCSDIDVGRECRKLMTELGLPPHIKGYRYAITAIRLMVEDGNILDAITKELYPAVAEVYSTTPCRVERGIRHGVELVWDRGDLDVLNRYFGNTVSIHKGKPTNSEFLATCAGIIRERMEEQNVQ